MIAFADARALPLADESVDVIVTSPPYFGLRTYGDDTRELGRAGLAEYLEDMGRSLTEMHRVLKPTGTLWLNMGDTANDSGGAGGDYNPGGSRQHRPRYRQGKSWIKGSQWSLVPQRVAILMQDSGWLIRSQITWDKGSRRPESLAHVRRPGVQSEVILMATKSRDYLFDPQGFIEEGDIWSFPAARRSSHIAPFPDELVERCLLLSPGQYVLDPFAGSGTTVRVAEALGRTGIGFDLYDFARG